MKSFETVETVPGFPELTIRIRRSFERSRLAEFALTLYVCTEGRNVVIERYDSNHETPHRHAAYGDNHPARAWQVADGTTLESALDNARAVVRANAVRHYQLWRANNQK